MTRQRARWAGLLVLMAAGCATVACALAVETEEVDPSEWAAIEAAMAKAYANEAAQRIIDDAIQILGGRGVMAEHIVDRLYRSVRALRIYEGTTEIQHLIIAGRMVADARAMLEE